jgi:hypothetical protein
MPKSPLVDEFPHLLPLIRLPLGGAGRHCCQILFYLPQSALFMLENLLARLSERGTIPDLMRLNKKMPEDTVPREIVFPLRPISFEHKVSFKCR